MFISKRKEGVNYFNPYKIYDDGQCEFYIKNKKGETFTVKVDREDLDRLIKFNRSWNAAYHKNPDEYYAKCCVYIGIENGKPKYETIYLHRWIMNSKDNEYVDHIERKETLDNRKSNLRVTTNDKNLKNRNGKNKNNQSGYRNVFWETRFEQWCVSLCIKYKRIVIGYFDDVHEAGKVAEEARLKYYGEFKGTG